jgi:sulfoxide reductase heme-binding subunit YedZ
MLTSTIAKNLKLVLNTLSWLMVIIIALSAFIQTRLLFPFGSLMGVISIVFFWFITIPGILRRFGVQGFLKNVQIILMTNRRQLGILMFLFALAHYFWLRAFNYLQFGFPDPQNIRLFERFGFFSLALTLPLFLTSNDWAKKKMKKWWQILHYLSYPAMLLIIFHTALQRSYLYATITTIIILIQVFSWLVFFNKKPKKI